MTLLILRLIVLLCCLGILYRQTYKDRITAGLSVLGLICMCIVLFMYQQPMI